MPAATPTPVAAPRPAAALVAVLPDFGRALAETARLDLYAANAFRSLGLYPPAEPAVIIARVQELLTGTAAPAWAFAPSLPLSTDQLHRAGQAADSPAERLAAELFWFWPEAYPENRADPALVALAAGNAEAAYGHWLAAPGSGVATHNMAVMFHYAALGRELEHGPLDDEARAWWTAAAEQWTATLVTGDLWRRWSARLALLGLPAAAAAETVAHVRAELPLVIARLSLLAAIERARRGELAEARWLREFAVRRLAAEETFSAVLAAALDGEQKRAEAALADAEERLTADDEPCLRHVIELLRQMALRRRIFDAVAGSDSSPLRRLGARVIEVGLAGLAEHERRAGADAAVLPWLMHLAGWPAAPEPRRAAAAALRQGWERLLGGGGSARHEAALRICAETLVPAIEQFAWDERAQAAYRQRVVAQLRALAREACLDTGEFDVTSQACALAAEILDEETRPLVVRERRQLWQQFQRAQNGALRLEFNGSVLEVDARQLRFDQRTWPVAALNGLRFGVTQGLGGVGPQVAWYAGREALVLDAVTWFDPVDGGAERYRQIVEALDACVVPVLAVRLAERVRAGQSVVCGASALRPDGFVFQRRPGQLVPETALPYQQLTQRVEAGDLVVGLETAPATEARYALGAVWNAVALPALLARLGETE